MSPLLQSILYLLVLTGTTFVAVARFNRLPRSLRIFTLFLIVTLLAELLAIYFDIRFHNNMPVYHFYAPVMLGILTSYFSEQLEMLKKKGLGFVIVIGGIIGAVANAYYWQPLKEWNANMVLFCGLCIIGMCLLYYRKLFLETGSRSPVANIHFWITSILLLFWSATFFIWAVLQVLLLNGMFETLNTLYLIIWLMNIVTYLAIAVTFLYFKPLK
jgi:hypothetical protein